MTHELAYFDEIELECECGLRFEEAAHFNDHVREPSVYGEVAGPEPICPASENTGGHLIPLRMLHDLAHVTLSTAPFR